QLARAALVTGESRESARSWKTLKNPKKVVGLKLASPSSQWTSHRRDPIPICTPFDTFLKLKMVHEITADGIPHGMTEFPLTHERLAGLASRRVDEYLLCPAS
ncbi:MAG: hypothetical protein QGI09_07410, partial [Dehalococcoidia bacterium]|nr:hypothetical protein [Dehalococcoidia bacterium]